MVNNLIHLRIAHFMEIQDYVEVHCQRNEKILSLHTLPTSIFEEDQDSWFRIEFDWKIIIMGYGTGLVIGMIVGNIVIEKKQH